MTAPEPPAPLPAEARDRMRRGMAIGMGAMGGFTLEGVAVTHVRTVAALRAGLDVTDGGETTVRIGAHWCYLTVQDCPLRATAVTQTNATALQIRLDDGRTVALDGRTLWEEPGRGLRCCAPSAVSGRALPVRFTNRAQMDLTPWLVFTESGAATLVLGAQRYAIASSSPGPVPAPATGSTAPT